MSLLFSIRRAIGAVAGRAPVPAPEVELRALFRAMTDRVIVVDRDGLYLQVPATSAPEWLIQHTVNQRSATRGLDSERNAALTARQLQAVRDAIDTGAPKSIEYPLQVGERQLWMSAVFSRLTDVSAIAVIRDITELVEAQQELEHRVAARTRDLSAMLEIAEGLRSTIELGPLIEEMVMRTQALVPYHRCSVYHIEDGDLVLLGSRLAEAEAAPPLQRLRLEAMREIGRRLEGGSAVLIDDVWGESDLAEVYRSVSGDLMDTASRGIRSWMGVPLMAKDRFIGVLALSHADVAFYSDMHVRIATAIASQAAVSVENARLHEEMLHLVAVTERQRLARELHDSVSQALYGISLGAQTAKSMLEPGHEANKPVDYLLSLTDAGMAEMRALIFELRPESLEVEGLVAAIQKQTLALAARYQIGITADLCSEPTLNLREKEMFYRVCLEALHNVVKHSRATEVHLSLQDGGDGTELEVRDNGIGFDPSDSFPGHIGLLSMRERAASAGASVTVTSSAGEGTTVRLLLKHQEPG